MKKYLANILGYFLIFSLAALLHGCNLNRIIEDALTDETEDGTNQLITAKIDGRDFSAESDFVEAELTHHSELNMFLFAISAGEPRFHEGEGVVAVAIGLVFHGRDFSSLTKESMLKPRKDIPTGDFPLMDDYYVEGLVVEDLENADWEYEARAPETIEVVITEIDHNNKLISGNFAFTAYDSDRDTHIEVTEGEFKNIRWTN